MSTGFVTVSSNMALAIDVAGATVPLFVADIHHPRKDLVLMRVLPWGTEVEVIVGTPAASPVPPARPHWSTMAFNPAWMEIAIVTVHAFGCVITEQDIENLV